MGSGNWIVDNLNSALEMWNGRLAEIWQLITTSPENFKGGGIWNVIVNINDGLKAVGYALLVLFFVMGVVKTCGSFAEMKKPEMAFKCFIRFVLAQAAVSWGMELMTGAFRVAQGMFFPALAPSYKEIILNSFDQYSLLKAYVRRIMDSYPGIQAEDHEKLEKALTQSLRDSEVDCIHKYLSAKFSDEAIDALVKEMEGRHDE